MDPHRLSELRSLAYHRAIAARLPAHPDLLAAARRRVARWLAEGGPTHPTYAERWAHLLEQPLDSIVAGLCVDDDDARALRACTPFAGALTARERWAIFREVGAAARADA